MIESSRRVREFKEDIAGTPISDPAMGRERLLGRVGGVLLIAGPVLGVIAYVLSHSGQALQQRDAIVLALLGVALAVTGAALFLRYSMANFLRFWMVRLVYEQKAQTDRLLGEATLTEGIDE